MIRNHTPHCSNCGHSLVPFRTDRSWTVKHEVETQWFTCPRCAHMSILRWAVTDTVEDSGLGEERAPERTLASA